MSNSYERSGSYPSAAPEASICFRPDLGLVAVRHGGAWEEFARNVAGAIALTSLALAGGLPGQALIVTPGPTSTWAPSVGGHNDFLDRNVTTTGSVTATQFNHATSLALATGGTTRATVDNVTVAGVPTNRMIFVPDVVGTIGMAQSLVSATTFLSIEGQAAKTGSGDVGGVLRLRGGFNDGATDRGPIYLNTSLVRFNTFNAQFVAYLAPSITAPTRFNFENSTPGVSFVHAGDALPSITGRQWIIATAAHTGTGSAGEDFIVSTGTGASLPLAGKIAFAPANITQFELYIDSNSTQVFRYFNTYTHRAGSGAPTISDAEGSTATRYGAGTGALYIRHNNNWDELARNAAGAISGSSVTDVSNTTHGVVTSITGTGKVLLSGSGTAAIWGAVTDTYVSDVAWGKITGRPTTLGGYGITDAVPSTRTISTTGPLTGGGALSGDLTLAIADVSNTGHGVVTSLTGTGKVLLSGTGTAAVWGAITDTYISDVAWTKLTGVPDASTSVKGIVQLAQDLAGTATAPTVVGLTGAAGVTAVHGAELKWDAGVSAPKIWQATAAAGVNGQVMTLVAQAGGSGNTVGGKWRAGGGQGAGTGNGGDAEILAGQKGLGGSNVDGTLFLGGAVINFTDAAGGSAIKMNLVGASGTGKLRIGDGTTPTHGLEVLGSVQFASGYGVGILHSSASGVLTSSLIVDADVTSVGWSKLTGIADVSNTVHGVVTAITGTGKVLLSGSGSAAVWGAITDTYISDVAWTKLTGVPDASSVKGIVKLVHDLGGTADIPDVVNISGNGIIALVRCAGIVWNDGIIPSLSQLAAAAGNGVAFSIFGQSGTASGTTDGGDVRVYGGDRHGSGLAGGVQLGIGSGANTMYEATEIAPGKYLSIFGHLTPASTAATGADPGSLNTMFGTSLQQPTTNPGAGNTIVYSTSKGLRQRCSDGVRVN